MKIIAATSIVAATLMGVAALGVSHAQAASTCRSSSKSFNLPGKADQSMTINLCVSRTGPGGRPRATADVKWGSWDTKASRKRFNSIKVQLRLERSDVSKGSLSHELASSLNAHADGSSPYIYLVDTTSTLRGGWSADATVTYDIADDGKSPATWDVTGSPLIS
ncbi:hypothetical protein [Planotetraspora mira]|nr:hypothetical protein [Planotetraspora mira]